MDILIYTAVFLGLLIFKLIWDKKAKDSGRIINHFQSALIDGILYTLSAYLLFGFRGVGYVVTAVGFRWLLFDIFFNLINNWEWNHYGSSSKLDKWLINLKDFHLVPKIITIAIGIALIFLI